MQEADLLPEGSPPRSTTPAITFSFPPSHTSVDKQQTWEEKCPQQYSVHLRYAVSLLLERSAM